MLQDLMACIGVAHRIVIGEQHAGRAVIVNSRDRIARRSLLPNNGMVHVAQAKRKMHMSSSQPTRQFLCHALLSHSLLWS